MEAKEMPGREPGKLKLNPWLMGETLGQRYNFCPKYNPKNAGIQEDINFVGGILQRLLKEISAEVERLTPKVEEGVKWATDVVTELNKRSDLLCDAWIHLYDFQNYPSSLNKTLEILREVSKGTLADLIGQHIRLMQGKPYAALLTRKVIMIDSAVTTARYYVSKVTEFFPKEKEDTL